MPYKSNSDINQSKRKGMTGHGQTIYRKAFNAALDKYGDEETAHKVANAAVTKAGERKKKESEEPIRFRDLVFEKNFVRNLAGVTGRVAGAYVAGHVLAGPATGMAIGRHLGNKVAKTKIGRKLGMRDPWRAKWKAKKAATAKKSESFRDLCKDEGWGGLALKAVGLASDIHMARSLYRNRKYIKHNVVRALRGRKKRPTKRK